MQHAYRRESVYSLTYHQGPKTHGGTFKGGLMREILAALEDTERKVTGYTLVAPVQRAVGLVEEAKIGADG